jgi:hypothetical protein
MTQSKEKLASLREKLAKVIHEHYLRDQQGKKAIDDPAMQPWERLQENLKESNRQQADQIPAKLQALGYSFRPVNGRHPKMHEFSPDEVEKLAIMEHERWLQEKLATGWRYGPERDDARKLSPSLVPYEQLSEAEKDKDRNPMRRIPQLLAEAGFEVNREE